MKEVGAPFDRTFTLSFREANNLTPSGESQQMAQSLTGQLERIWFTQQHLYLKIRNPPATQRRCLQRKVLLRKIPLLLLDL